MIEKYISENLKNEMQNAFEEIEQKHDIQFVIGDILFDGDVAKFDVQIKLNERMLIKNEREFFKEYCKDFGLNPIDYLQEIELEDEEGEKRTYEIFGFDIHNDKVKIRNIKTGEAISVSKSTIHESLLTNVIVAENKTEESPKMLKRVHRRHLMK